MMKSQETEIIRCLICGRKLQSKNAKRGMGRSCKKKYLAGLRGIQTNMKDFENMRMNEIMQDNT